MKFHTRQKCSDWSHCSFKKSVDCFRSQRHYLEYSKRDHVSSRPHSHVPLQSRQFILSHWKNEAHGIKKNLRVTCSNSYICNKSEHCCPLLIIRRQKQEPRGKWQSFSQDMRVILINILVPVSSHNWTGVKKQVSLPQDFRKKSCKASVADEGPQQLFFLLP